MQSARRSFNAHTDLSAAERSERLLLWEEHTSTAQVLQKLHDQNCLNT
jgi:hypothetical protein